MSTIFSPHVDHGIMPHVGGTNLQVENTNVTAARSLLTTLGAADTHLSPMTHLEASSVFR